MRGDCLLGLGCQLRVDLLVMGHHQLLIQRGGFLFLLVNEVFEHLFVLQIEGEVVLLVDAETVPSLVEVHS